MASMIRLATVDDADALTRARLDFMQEIWPESGEAAIEAVYRETREHLLREMARGAFIGYLLFEGKSLASSAALLLYELPPKPGGVKRVIGEVLNVFTYPQFRRRGYGRELMSFIVADATARGLFRLVLSALPDGVALYETLGFQKPDAPWLELDLV